MGGASRRKLVKAFFRSTAVLAAVSGLGVFGYLVFVDHSERVKLSLVSTATSVLGRNVEVDVLALDWKRLGFSLRGVRVAALEVGPPFLQVDEVDGELSLAAFFSREVRLRRLVVRGLTVRVADFGGGRIDVGITLPRPSAPGTRPPIGIKLASDRVRIENATFVYNNVSVPWHFEAAAIASSLEQGGDGVYLGTMSYREGEFAIKERKAARASMDARFEISETELRVVELRGSGPFYDLAAKGKVALGRRPQNVPRFERATLEFDARAELGPALESLVGFRALESPGGGRGRMTGVLHIGPGWHEMRGNLSVDRARFWGAPLRDWTAEISWDRAGIAVTEAKGVLAEGPATATLRQAFPSSLHATDVTVEFQDAFSSSVLHAVPGAPALESRLTGRARLSFPPSRAEAVSGSVEILGTAPPGAAEGVDFHVSGVLDDGNLRLDVGTLQMNGLLARLSGVYPRRGDALFNVEAESSDVARADSVQQAVRRFLHPARNAGLVGATGTGRASGIVRGREGNLVFEGRASFGNVSFRGVSWGRVEAEGTLSPEAVDFTRLTARKGEGELDLRGRIELSGEPFWERALRLEGKIAGWPAADVEKLTGQAFSPTGRLTGEGRLESPGGGKISADAAIALAGGSFRGTAFDSSRARLQVARDVLRFSAIELNRGGATVEGDVALDLSSKNLSGAFRASNVAVSELPFADVAAAPVTAAFGGTLRVSGNLETPQLEIEAASSDVSLFNVSLGRADLKGRLEAGTLSSRLEIQGVEKASPVRLLLEARASLDGDRALEGTLRWESLDSGPLLRSVRRELPPTFALRSSGETRFKGRLGALRSIEADGRIATLDVSLGDYKLAAVSPFAAELTGSRLLLEGLELRGAQTELGLDGGFGLDGSDLRLQAKGSVNPRILESFLPALLVGGRTEVSAQIRGTLKEPLFSGYADLSGGSLRLRDFPQTFGDIHGRLAFDNRNVELGRIEARFGGAPVVLSGRILVNGLMPEAFDIRGSGRGVRIRYPEGLVATVDAELLLSGTLREQVLSGRVDVKDALWTREYDLTTELLTNRERGIFEEPGPLDRLRFDIQVDAPSSLRVRNAAASVDASAALQLRGTYARPALLGRAEAERGEIFFMGQRYALTRSRIDFVDPLAVKPLFDVTAQTRVRSYQIQLRLAGTTDRFYPELTSDPPLRTVDILRLLAGGSERDVQLGTEEEEVAGVGVAGLLTGRLTQELGRRAGRLFGLDRFSIDPFLIGQFANPTARVTLGKRISRDIQISYSTNLNTTTETIIVIEYNPGGRFSWLVSRDETGAFGIDFKIRRSF